MIAALCAAALALAAAPPARPVAPAGPADDCLAAVEVVPGDAPPTCHYLAIPVRGAVQFGLDEQYLTQLQTVYVADTTALEQQRDAYKAEVADLRKRPPLVVGVAIGVGSTGLLALGIYEVARVLVAR